MPGIRGRDQSDKIKNQSKRKNGKSVKHETRRVMTAKLKKELVQQKRSSSSVTEQPRDSSATIEAVNQVEQATGASVHEGGLQIKQGVSRAVTKAKKEQQQIKERLGQPKGPSTGQDILSPKIPEQHTSVIPEAGPAACSEPSPSRPSPSSIPRQAPTPPDRPPTLKVRPDSHQDRPTGPRERPAGTSSKQAVFKDRAVPVSISPKPRPADVPIRPTEPKTRPISSSVAVKKQTVESAVSPVPGDHMLQQAVDHQKELFCHPERPVTTPSGSR